MSVICLGVVHAACCGSFPSDEKIRVEAHKIASPDGIPSLHPSVVGNGEAYEPPTGTAGVAFVRMNTVLLKLFEPFATSFFQCLVSSGVIPGVVWDIHLYTLPS